MQVRLKKQLIKLFITMLILLGFGLLIANQSQAITLTAHLYRQMNWNDEYDCWKWEIPKPDFNHPPYQPPQHPPYHPPVDEDIPGDPTGGNPPDNTAPVPEPATMFLLGTGMLLLAAAKRKLS